MTTHFDIIVVGAGPAGSAAAKVAAQGGARVALLERGLYPGCKNVSGAGLYDTALLERLYPGFAKEAPIERYISKKMLGFITPQQLLTISYEDGSKGQEPYQGYTVLRPRLDQYLAKEAQKAGATLLTETTVTGVIKENGQVTGVMCNGQEPLHAKIVIACDGVNSFIPKELGLQKPANAHELSLGVKEVISLPKEVIQERFRLQGNEGAAFELVGSASMDVYGGGFLYTNQESLSIGIVAQVDCLQKTGHTPYELLQSFKAHPAIAPYLAGGIVEEYGAHLIPEGGYGALAKFSDGGILVAGDSAGFVLVTGYLLLGINFALESGSLAGETALKALAKQAYSAPALKDYDKALEAAGLLQTFKNFKKAPAGAVNNPNLQNLYPDLVCALMANLYDVGNKPIQKILPLALQTLKAQEIAKTTLVKDAWKIGGSLLW